MALFTIIAAYGGGMYATQVEARTAKLAAKAFPSAPGIREISIAAEVSVAEFAEALAQPTFERVEGLDHCWEATAEIRGDLLLLFIVQTAESVRRASS
jgi:hypothetical protein